MLAIAIAVTTVSAVFYANNALGWNLYPRADQTPFWLGINGVEIITSFLDSGLINMVFGSSIVEYIAYLIRGISDLFFLMLGMHFAFRFFERRS